MADAQRSGVIKDDSFHFEKFKGLVGRLLKVPKEELDEMRHGEGDEKSDNRSKSVKSGDGG